MHLCRKKIISFKLPLGTLEHLHYLKL